MIKEITDIQEFLSLLKEHNFASNPYARFNYYIEYFKKYVPQKFICFVVYKNNHIIGFLPLEKKNGFYTICGYKVSNYVSIICKEEDTELVFSELNTYLHRRHIIINFYDINSRSPLYSLLEKTSTKKIDLYPCPVVNINQSFEELFTTQITNSKKRTELRKFQKKIENIGTIKLINIHDTQSYLTYKNLLPRIFSIHKERFKDTNLNSNVSLSENEEYYSKLIESMAISENIYLSLLLLDEVVISFLFLLVEDDLLIDWMPAFDPAFLKYSLGTVHLKMLFEELCVSDKYKRFDFSKGAGLYKDRWASIETTSSMFLRRYSDNIFVKLRFSYLSFYYSLISLLRYKGTITLVKKFLLKKDRSEQETSTYSINYVSTKEHSSKYLPFDYSYVIDEPISFRKLLLDELYKGSSLYIVKDTRKVIIVSSK